MSNPKAPPTSRQLRSGSRLRSGAGAWSQYWPAWPSAVSNAWRSFIQSKRKTAHFISLGLVLVGLAVIMLSLGGLVASILETPEQYLSWGVIVPADGLPFDPPAEDSVSFTYELKRLKIPEMQVTGTAHIWIGEGLAKRLYDREKSQFIINGIVIRPGYEAVALNLRLTQEGRGDVRMSVPLSCTHECVDDQGQHRFGGTHQDLALDATGQPQQYPRDAYEVNSTVILELPPNIHVRDDEDQNDPDEPFFHEVSTGVKAHSSVSGKIIRYISQDTDTELLHLRDLKFTIQRDFWAQASVYSSTAAPLLLTVVLTDLLRRTRRLGPSSLATLLIGLAAVVLTVLPLRAVLVPQDITDLTTVDRMLGLQLMVLVCVVIGIYARRLWNG